jgi:hypothetical protein
MYNPLGCDDAGRRRVGAKEDRTMYTLKQAMRVLGIGDVRTLHALLKQAGIVPARGEQDKRQRVLTPEQVERLRALRGEKIETTPAWAIVLLRAIEDVNERLAKIERLLGVNGKGR